MPTWKFISHFEGCLLIVLHGERGWFHEIRLELDLNFRAQYWLGLTVEGFRLEFICTSKT